MNWTKGFNRVFAVLALGWFVFLLLVYPFVLRLEDQRTYFSATNECRDQMTESLKNGTRYEGAREVEQDCEDLAKISLDGSVQLHSISTWSKGRLLLLLLAAVILPPAITYGLFRLGWVIVDWIGRGFRQPAA